MPGIFLKRFFRQSSLEGGDPMAEEKFRRKLTAILSADVAGYSRLMAENETATVKTLETYREVMSTLIMQHRGRVIDSPGDNLLAEFTSVVDAVQCAVAVQKEFQARNAQLPENRRMEFRIGINLGDVIEEEDRIYGDGVNIAARLEALADPGGICVSKTAFDQIETKLPLGYEYLGEQPIKNIPKPVGAYRVLMDPRVTVAEEIERKKPLPSGRRKAILAGGVALLVVVIAALIWNFYFRPPPLEVASVERMSFPLPDKPSIAVLPFVNMSGDPKQEYLADGITENIISALSQVPKLFVIARQSTFSYKNKPVKIQRVAEELGVRYVLEGSVQRSGDSLRITAQLINALGGHHLWSERYDRELKDIFSLQDEITTKVITELRVKLTTGEQARLHSKGTENLQAYLEYLQAREIFLRFSPDDNTRAQKMLKEVIAMDSEYPMPIVLLAYSHVMDVFYRTSKSPKQSFMRAMKLAQKAIAIDQNRSSAHNVLGFIYMFMRRHDEAIAEGEIAIKLDPNGAQNHVRFGQFLYTAGKPEKAILSIERGIRLNPFPPSWYFHSLSAAYRIAGRYEEAIKAGKKAIEIKPKDQVAWLSIAASYSVLGRLEEANVAAKEILQINPKYCIKAGKGLYKNQADTERYNDALRKAGLPDCPPRRGSK
jgi:adenylate cyclase